MPSGTFHDEEKNNHSLIDHLNAFNDGIFISEQNGICLYTNDALCSMLGYDYSGALFDLNILDYIAPEFRDEFREILAQTGKLLPEDHSISILPLRKRNGQMILAEISLSFNTINNRIISITAIVRDLSAREVSQTLKEKLATHYPGLLKDLPVPHRSGKQIKEELIGNESLNKHEFQVNVVLQEIKSNIDKELRAQGSRNLILSLTTYHP